MLLLLAAKCTNIGAIKQLVVTTSLGDMVLRQKVSYFVHVLQGGSLERYVLLEMGFFRSSSGRPDGLGGGDNERYKNNTFAAL